MNKAPAFQFYVADYMRDTRCLSLAAKGAWTDCLCAMWFASTRGELTYPLIGFARLFGCTVEQAKSVIDELAEMQVCDCVTHDDGKMTLVNRRMRREAKARKAANNRQLAYTKRKKGVNDATDDGANDEKMMSYSSSSSTNNVSGGGRNSYAPAREKPPPDSSTTTAEIVLTPAEKRMSRDEFAAAMRAEFAHLSDVNAAIAECVQWYRQHRNAAPKRLQVKKWLAGEDEVFDVDKAVSKPDWGEAQNLIARKYGGKATDGA
jgi:uncharacterized protein YdaU (DUF1376 family)